MSHSIDMSDHFAHFDKSISIYNFLQFSDSWWKWVDNSIQPQNRARIYDYKNLYRENAIPISEETYRAGSVEELRKIKLHEKYKSTPLEELAKRHCHFISYLTR